MGHRVALIALATAMVSAVLGCGGSRGTGPSGGHTYIYVPLGARKGVYVTLVSPVAVPTNALRNKGFKVVAQAKGPQDCSITKTIQGGHGKAAHLNGKTLTVKVNGSNPGTQSLCEAFTTERFTPAFIGK
jgi:hypothetical protein